MIRWFIGFFLVIGSAGGLEQDTMTISECLAFAFLGFALILHRPPLHPRFDPRAQTRRRQKGFY